MSSLDADAQEPDGGRPNFIIHSPDIAL